MHPHALRPPPKPPNRLPRAAAKEAFWTMHDLLFENQDALQQDDVIEFAAAAGVDPIEVANDLASGAKRERVQRDVTSGRRSGVRGTPTFFVNGRRFEGDSTDPLRFRMHFRTALAVTRTPPIEVSWPVHNCQFPVTSCQIADRVLLVTGS